MKNKTPVFTLDRALKTLTRTKKQKLKSATGNFEFNYSAGFFVLFFFRDAKLKKTLL